MINESNGRIAYSNIGMVATAHYEASKVGADILKNGGNAFDAAVAACFVIGVCEPNASGLGGGGFMTAHSSTDNKDIFVDFREVAPATASPDMWARDENGEIINNEKSEGGKSICVPGELAGLCHILKKYGTMSLEQVIKPAISLANKGVVISESLHSDLVENREKMIKFKEEGNPYLKEYKSGDYLHNEMLANTLSKISKEGPDYFYKGALADEIVKSINKHGGDFTKSDLENYKVKEYTPIEGEYRGFKILSSPPPSSGGTHVIEILNILENFDIKNLTYHSVDHVHLLSEIFKMCFADRANYMGDPNFVEIPLKELVSKQYAKIRSTEYSNECINNAMPGNPKDVEPCDTTHLSIADKYGNVVSVTKTISAFFGSGVVPKNTGIVLNCQMRGFSSGYGKSNSVCGGKKPLSSMSPTIIMKDNRPFAIIGTPGGNRIISTMSQIISNLIDFNMDLESAIDAPRIYNDVENVLHYESRINENVFKNLFDKGQSIQTHKPYDRYFGGVQGICYLDDGVMIGVADPRRDGRSIGS